MKKERFEKKVRFNIEVQPGNQAYTALIPRRAQCPESGKLKALTSFSANSDLTGTEESRKLIPRTTGPDSEEVVTESTVTIGTERTAFFVSPDFLTTTARESNNSEPFVGLQSTAGQSELGIQRVGEKCTSPLPDRKDRESAGYPTGRVFWHRGKRH